MPIPSALPTISTAKYTAFRAAEWNFQTMLPILISVYSDFIGPNSDVIVYASIIFTILGIIWMRQEDVALPAFVMLILGNVMYWSHIVPADWQWLIVVLFILLPIVAIAYSWWRKR